MQPEISQELMFKLQMYEQQINQLQQQLEAVRQGIVEMEALDKGLSELVGKKGKEIFAPVGRGIFARAKLESEDLNVDVGGGNMVKKTIPETKKIIADQLGKLEEVQKQLEDALEKMSGEIQKVIAEEQGKQEGKDASVGEGERKGTKKKIDELV